MARLQGCLPLCTAQRAGKRKGTVIRTSAVQPPPLHNPTDTHRTYPLALLPVHTSESCPQSNPDSLLSKRTAVCGCEDRRWHLWMCTTLLVRFLKPYTLRGECQRFRRFLCVAYSVNKTLGSVSVWCGEKGERGEGCKVRSEIS